MIYHKMHYTPHTLKGLFLHLLDSVSRNLEKMPVAQGSIISVALGITVGSLLFRDIGAAVYVTDYLAAGMSIFMGSLALWMFNAEPKHEKVALTGGVIVLMVLSVSRLIINDLMILDLIQNLSVIVLTYTLFMVGLHGYTSRHRH